MANPPPLPPHPPGFYGPPSTTTAFASSYPAPHPHPPPPVPHLPPDVLARERRLQEQAKAKADLVAPTPRRFLPSVPVDAAYRASSPNPSAFPPAGFALGPADNGPPHFQGSPRPAPATLGGPRPMSAFSAASSASSSQSYHIRPNTNAYVVAADRPFSSSLSDLSLYDRRPSPSPAHHPPPPLGDRRPSYVSEMGLLAKPTANGPPSQQRHSRYASSTLPSASTTSLPNTRFSNTPPPNASSSSLSAASSQDPPLLAAPLPDMPSLTSMRERAFASADEQRKLGWAKQVLKYVERRHFGADASPDVAGLAAPAAGGKITDATCVKYTDEAIRIILDAASKPSPVPEALYLRGDLNASGSFPSYCPRNLKAAFSDFELAARSGWAPAWFRIARDYEVLGDVKRAKDAYERGVEKGDCGCIYRMGMASLLGQLSLTPDPARAITLLRSAADRADLDTPQPAYIYGMLLAGEFDHVDIPKHLIVPVPDPSNPRPTLESEARRRIERAAYLNFAPAQYKMGYLHEYAQLGCPFDPLLSVQYYSLASQGGDAQSALALSRWFLCGAEGLFEKNENLAFTLADKAAVKGLASGEFALAYYYEVGVGCKKDVKAAREWYEKAAAQGNADAKERLEALGKPDATPLSRTEHEAHVDNKLQRKLTQARLKSEKEAGAGGPAAAAGGRNELARRRTLKQAEMAAWQSFPAAAPANTRIAAGPLGAPQQQQQQQPGGYGPSSHPASSPPSVVGPPAAATASRPVLKHQMSGGFGVGAVRPPGHGLGHANSVPVETRHGRGFSLVDAPVAPPQAQAQAQARSNVGGAGGGRGGRPPAGNNVRQPSSGANGGRAAGAETTTGAGGKKYQTFEEMGFKAQKLEDKDCVVM